MPREEREADFQAAVVMLARLAGWLDPYVKGQRPERRMCSSRRRTEFVASRTSDMHATR
jgi:hypothetical protein